jgi:hypothetical protein
VVQWPWTPPDRLACDRGNLIVLSLCSYVDSYLYRRVGEGIRIEDLRCSRRAVLAKQAPRPTQTLDLELLDVKQPRSTACLKAALALYLFLSVALVALGVGREDALQVPAAGALRARLETEIQATGPDYVVYVPDLNDGKFDDTGNEHFLVFDGPDGSLMAVWTQSSFEGRPDQRIVFSQSRDEGKTWSLARRIAGPAVAGEGPIASWAFPMVSRSGRIYVIYNQHVGRFDTFFHTTGAMDGIYSDNHGTTWSRPERIKMPRSNRDNPDESYPANWICWQKPLRLAGSGRYLAGFTRWTSKAVKKNPTRSWISHDSHVEFMRFDNVDDDPAVRDLKISWFAQNDDALGVPFPGHPETSVCQEPSLVRLPDGRLFCVMRTSAGSPFWSQSDDEGESWTQPRRLLRSDGGEPLRHPLSPCPIFDREGGAAASGRYVLFVHNHDGNYQGFVPTDTQHHRRPIYSVMGRFRPGADQPVWFDAPKLLMDHTGVALGPPGQRGRLDLALYSSFTVHNGKAVLWYPDRKFFLLGKVIADSPTVGPAD